MLEFIQRSADLIIGEKIVENVFSLTENVAETTGIKERIVDSEEFYPAFMNYKGPMRQFCKDMNKHYNVIRDAADTCQEYIGETYAEPTYLSSGASEFLGLGAYFLTGGGVLGASSKLATNKIVEPLVRKAQYYVSEERNYHLSEKELYQEFTIDDSDSIDIPGPQRALA